MNPSFQEAFNLAKGSIRRAPMCPTPKFEACGKKSMADLKVAIKNDTMVAASLRPRHAGRSQGPPHTLVTKFFKPPRVASPGRPGACEGSGGRQVARLAGGGPHASPPALCPARRGGRDVGARRPGVTNANIRHDRARGPRFPPLAPPARQARVGWSSPPRVAAAAAPQTGAVAHGGVTLRLRLRLHPWTVYLSFPRSRGIPSHDCRLAQLQRVSEPPALVGAPTTAVFGILYSPCPGPGVLIAILLDHASAEGVSGPSTSIRWLSPHRHPGPRGSGC